MPAFDHELRLLALLVINAAVLASAWRLAGRTARGAGRAWRGLDTLLLWYAVQYVSVCVPGVLYVLTTPAMDAVAVLLAATMWVAGKRGVGAGPIESLPLGRQRLSPDPAVTPLLSHGRWRRRVDRLIPPAALLFACGFVGAFAWHQRSMPAITTDPLVYHMPTAVHWLQTRSLAMFEAWFWMPANSYSPLAGTTFIVWLLGPIGNDAIARGVQLPTAALIFLSLYVLCRSLSVPATVAACVAAVVVVCRPFSSQIWFQKDDLFVAAFFLVVVAAMDARRLRDRWAPWRIGLALGLLIACKYTVLILLPVLLLGIDAPFRAGWRWRQWATAVVLTGAIAGPWYARNWVCTGNPLYPLDVTVAGHRLFTGLFAPTRSDLLRSPAGAWHLLAGEYHSMPPALLLPMLALATLALALAGRRLVREPLARIALLGFPVGLALFVAKAPLVGVRYVFPLYLLLCAAGAIGAVAIAGRRQVVAETLGAAVLLVAVATSLETSNAWSIALFTSVGVAVAIAATGYLALRASRPGAARLVAGATGLMLALWGYVDWRSFLNDYSPVAQGVFARVYPDVAPAWAFVDENVPPDATVAYTNAYTIYPLYGFACERRLVYAPVRPGLRHLHDLPRLPDDTAPIDVLAVVARVTHANADRATWIANLRATGAAYLFISKTEAAPNPPELRFAAADPAMFVLIFDSPAAVIYRLNLPPDARGVQTGKRNEG